MFLEFLNFVVKKKFINELNNIFYEEIWREVLDVGKRKDRWDGSGNAKELDVKKEKEEKKPRKIIISKL